MKKRKHDILILLIYAIPYVFFGMLGDVVWHTLLLYVLMVAALVGLLVYCMKTNRLPIAMIGNLLSVLTSCLLCQYFATEQWNHYFMFFPAIGRALQFSGIMLVVQAVIWWFITYYQKEKDAS